MLPRHRRRNDCQEIYFFASTSSEREERSTWDHFTQGQGKQPFLSCCSVGEKCSSLHIFLSPLLSENPPPPFLFSKSYIGKIAFIGAIIIFHHFKQVGTLNGGMTSACGTLKLGLLLWDTVEFGAWFSDS